MNFFLCHTFSFEGFIKSQDPNKKSNYNLMCIKKSSDSDSESTKSINLLIAFSVPFFIILISMFCSIIYSLRTQGLKKRIPHIIGNYRRNILSLNETFIYAISILCSLYGGSIALKFYTVFGFSVKEIRLYCFTQGLVIHNILEGIIWPCYVLWNLHDKMPEFYSDKTIFAHKFSITGQPKLEPRRMDDYMEANYYERNIPRNVTSNITFKRNNSFPELPPIVQ